jgi:sporulation protein YlmC with PRC-barrel domain
LISLLRIGAVAVTSDEYRGEVRAAVIDPVAAVVTHLVVEPEGRSGLARLVPLSLAEAEADTDDYDVRAAPGKLRLSCTEAEFMNLDGAEETLAEFAVGQTVPVQLLPPGWRGTGEPVAEGGDILRIPERETVDVVPPGQVEEHGGDHVHATDGDIGRLHGFRIDPGSGRVTHVLLGEGHAWGRKDVAIPFDKITGFDDGITLSLTKRQVKDLPEIKP